MYGYRRSCCKICEASLKVDKKLCVEDFGIGNDDDHFNGQHICIFMEPHWIDEEKGDDGCGDDKDDFDEDGDMMSFTSMPQEPQ